MKIRKQEALFLLLLYLFLFRIPLEQSNEIFKYMDEVAAFFAIPIFLFRLCQNHLVMRLESSKFGYGRWVALLVCIGLVGSFCYQYQPFIAVISDLYLVIKFWLAIYIGKFLGQYLQLERCASAIFFHIKLLVFLYVLLIVADNVSGGIFPADIRYGLRSTQLFYGHPTGFVGCCMLLIAILIGISDYISGSSKYFVLLLVLMCTSLRSKAFGIAVVVSIIYWSAYKRRKK